MQVQLAGNGLGGIIQGNWGTYQAAADGTFTVDTRDVSPMLVLGMSYVNKVATQYNTEDPPAAAAVGKFVASGALSNGVASIANQPDVPRQAALVVGTGTTALTAGTVSVVYLANDGTTQTDVLSVKCALSSTTTQNLSKGVVHITSVTVAGVTGGTSPFYQLNSTAALSVPVGPGAVDFAVQKETIDTGDETVGTVSTTTLGTITPTTAPNATHTYGFEYTYIGPDF